MRKTVLVASGVLILAMSVGGGVAYGRSSAASRREPIRVAPAKSDTAAGAKVKTKKDCLSRACAWITPGGGFVGSASHKGVLSVSQIQPGQYCVELVSTIPAATATPLLDTDYTWLTQSHTYALVFAAYPTCGTNGIDVVTYYVPENLDTIFISDGFTIVVP